MSTWKQTTTLIPEGVQTLSKRVCCHVADVYPEWIEYGKGSKIFDAIGRKYIDYPCSLGATILGHAYPAVVEAVTEQLKKGTLFSLSHPMETELAELMHDVFPSMEVMRFVKTGSESCQAAVRVARAYTGREPILCCGYHGWHSWYNCTTPKNAGSIKQDVTPVEWGDVRKLEELLIEKKPAAFILEPYVYEDEGRVEKWLKEVRKLCTVHKTVMILDENVTGFRTRKLSAQNHWKIKPDLSCFGKAMANGVPMACFGGNRDIMKVLESNCFVSSTFGGDLLGISAAIATIKVLRNKAAINHIWVMGSKMKTAFNQAAQAIMKGEDIKCIGLPPRTCFIFPTTAHKGLFWQECLKQGIFFGYAQFVGYSHDLTDIDKTISVMRQAMKMVNKHYDNPEGAMQGQVPQETMRMITVPPPKFGDKDKNPPMCKKCNHEHWSFQKCSKG